MLEIPVKIVARMWNQVDPTMKAYYTELARQDKCRYAIEVFRWKHDQEKARPVPALLGQSQPESCSGKYHHCNALNIILP